MSTRKSLLQNRGSSSSSNNNRNSVLLSPGNDGNNNIPAYHGKIFKRFSTFTDAKTLQSSLVDNNNKFNFKKLKNSIILYRNSIFDYLVSRSNEFYFKSIIILFYILCIIFSFTITDESHLNELYTDGKCLTLICV